MRTSTTTTASPVSSGAGLDVFNDANALTLAAVGVGAVTAGGAVFVGLAVAPSQVLGGALAASALAVGGEVKSRTGSYLPFLKEKKQEAAPVTEAAAS